MTKNKAIQKTLIEVGRYTEWREEYKAWFQHRVPLNRHELKKARIAYAMILLGIDHDTAQIRAWLSDEFDGLSFRQAIYSVDI